jgi:hypothetical protein
MIIGLVGFAGSGKNTVADILRQDFYYQPLAFADAVKDAVSVIFDWDRDLLEGDTTESRTFRETEDQWWSAKLGYKVTPRFMLQLMGTEAGRDVFGQNLWIASLEKSLKRYIDHYDEMGMESDFVITDVRFPNEIESIRNMGGKIVQVSRGENPSWYNLAEKANKENNFDLMLEHRSVHHSEWAWIGSEVDAVIHNNEGIDELRENVTKFLQSHSSNDIIQ